jgi:deazaflavin-dependent oxidoreductase (nitroreductase family)
MCCKPVPTNLQRVLKTVGESPFWRATGRLHTWLYQTTGGRVGHSAGSIKNLLLTTTGRKTGQARTCPLTYMPDDGRYILVASNGGSDRPPAWWFNLKKTPRATVQVGAETFPVTAADAGPEERARLWPRLKTYNPFYAQYEQITERTIPVVILTRTR